MSEPAAALAGSERFDRFRRIAWWNQTRISLAKILVIGAGALGNEILKNLALLGIGNIFVADLDNIEESNLSRSVLFRPGDKGKSKAQVAAESVSAIYPGARVQWFHGDVIFGLGLGVFRWADVVVCGLDNREARLAVSNACWKTNRPFVDGATETFDGTVRVFAPPDGPCYACGLSEMDWELIRERKGCFGAKAAGVLDPTIPTTPVTASVIAGLQCQETIKLLLGAPSLAGGGLVFGGRENTFYTFRLNKDNDCMYHEVFDRVVPLSGSVRTVTGRQLLARAASDLGAGAQVRFHRLLLTTLRCASCATREDVFRPVASVSDDTVPCPSCGKERQADTCDILSGAEAFLDRPLADLAVPPFDVLAVDKGLETIGYEFAGDGAAVLGPLWGTAAAEGRA